MEKIAEHYEVSGTDAKNKLLESIIKTASIHMLPIHLRQIDIQEVRPFPNHRINILLKVACEETADNGVELAGTVSPLGGEAHQGNEYFYVRCLIEPPRT